MLLYKYITTKTTRFLWNETVILAMMNLLCIFSLICLLRNGHAGPIIQHLFPPGTLALPLGIERCIYDLPTSGSLIRSLFYVFTSREGIYTCVFCAVPAFVAGHGRGSCRHPSLCSGSCSPGCDISFQLPFIT